MASPIPATLAEELELADRARFGDHRAISELYQRYQAAIYRHAHHLLGDPSSAHDVMQETFTRAIAALDRTQPQLKFKAWIYRIATNLCLRQLNQRSRWHSADVNRFNSAPLTGGDDPRQVRLSKEIGVIVVQVLDQLPLKYRQVLLLREVEELSYEEIAQVMELTQDNVKVTLHRARQRFALLFTTAQLMANPHLPIACAQLQQLVQQAAQKRQVQKHLESCAQCQRDKLPIADLFTLLPPAPLVQDLATTTSPGASSSPLSPSNTASSAGPGGWLAAHGGLLLALTAAVALGLIAVGMMLFGGQRAKPSIRAGTPNSHREKNSSANATPKSQQAAQGLPLASTQWPAAHRQGPPQVTPPPRSIVVGNAGLPTPGRTPMGQQEKPLRGKSRLGPHPQILKQKRMQHRPVPTTPPPKTPSQPVQHIDPETPPAGSEL